MVAVGKHSTHTQTHKRSEWTASSERNRGHRSTDRQLANPAFRPTPAIKAFLTAIPARSLTGVKVSAFDTGMPTADINSRFLNVMVKAFGYAAEPIANRLKAKSGELVIEPEGLFVQASERPLKDGELQRARDRAGRMYAAQ